MNSDLYTEHDRRVPEETPGEEHDRRGSEEMLGEAIACGAFDTEEFVAPGAPIIRSSTPRPLSFGLVETRREPSRQESVPIFPVEAPSAPPVPEEDEQAEDRLHAVDVIPLPGQTASLAEASHEFVWLFEYGLEMDGAILNSAERLNGLALLYGVALLKGYELTFDVLNVRAGHVVATIIPSRNPVSEVWGLLYRIPDSIAEQNGHEQALLDKAHSAAAPDGLFERVAVTVQETYRGREVACITYIGSAIARNSFHLLPRDRQHVEPSYVEHLLRIARKQKLPEDYLYGLTTIAAPTSIEPPIVVSPPPEQNTEPLPILNGAKQEVPVSHPPRQTLSTARSAGLVIFALYMVLMLLTVFTLILLQGLGIGNNLLPATFTPLGIPWYVLVYGLIGGCLSCLVAIGRRYASSPPAFVIISWFTRPLVGMILAALVYLLLNSGLFVLAGNAQQHNILFSLFAVAAGACEGWLFSKRT